MYDRTNVLSIYALKVLKECFQALKLKSAQAQAQMLNDQIMLESIFKHFKKKCLKCFQAQALKCLPQVWYM